METDPTVAERKKNKPIRKPLPCLWERLSAI